MGFIVNNVKYIYLCNDNDLKKKSLCDNLYFTLRDVFINCDSYDILAQANKINGHLTNNTYLEERPDEFIYSNILEQIDYVKRIINWLKSIKNDKWFEFTNTTINNEYKYMRFDDWWDQYKELIILLENRLETLEENELLAKLESDAINAYDMAFENTFT